MCIGPALPLGQLGNCLRPPSGRGAPNFRKEGIVGKKIFWFQMNIKNPTHPFDQKTKFLLYPVKQW